MRLCIRQPLSWRTARGMLSLKPMRIYWKRKNLPLKGNANFSVVYYILQRFCLLTYAKHTNLCIAGRSSKCLSWNSVSERVSSRCTVPSWDVEPLTPMCVCWDYRLAHMHAHSLFPILYQNISVNRLSSFCVCDRKPSEKMPFCEPSLQSATTALPRRSLKRTGDWVQWKQRLNVWMRSWKRAEKNMLRS